MSEARRDEKRVLLEVGGNWCGWCRELERFVTSDPAVAEAIRCAFVVVRVNVSPENPNARFLSAYPDIPGYPYLFVLDAKGSLLAEVDTDDFLRGESYDRTRLLAFVTKWSRPGTGTAGS
jgi:thiol:disulfide interchange protein